MRIYKRLFAGDLSDFICCDERDVYKRQAVGYYHQKVYTYNYNKKEDADNPTEEIEQ